MFCNREVSGKGTTYFATERYQEKVLHISNQVMSKESWEQICPATVIINIRLMPIISVGVMYSLN